MGYIDQQLVTIEGTTEGKELKEAIIEALDILDKKLPIKEVER